MGYAEGPCQHCPCRSPLAAKLAAAGAKAVGADRTSEYLGSRKLVFDTEVGNEIDWLVITELLELPFRQGDRVSHRDALAEAILSAPELQERLHKALGTIGRKGDDAAFRERLEETLETYAGTWVAAAEIATSLSFGFEHRPHLLLDATHCAV